MNQGNDQLCSEALASELTSGSPGAQASSCHRARSRPATCARENAPHPAPLPWAGFSVVYETPFFLETPPHKDEITAQVQPRCVNPSLVTRSLPCWWTSGQIEGVRQRSVQGSAGPGPLGPGRASQDRLLASEFTQTSVPPPRGRPAFLIWRL